MTTVLDKAPTAEQLERISRLSAVVFGSPTAVYEKHLRILPLD